MTAINGGVAAVVAVLSSDAHFFKCRKGTPKGFGLLVIVFMFNV